MWLRLAIGAVAGMVETVGAQQWQELAAPVGRSATVMAHDLARGQTVLFGGQDDISTLQDTWVLDGGGWRLVTNWPDGPWARHRSAMAFDWGRGRCVLFGGDLTFFPPFYPVADTWEFAGARWKQVVTANAPAARAGHAMVFDSTHRVVVLFGGGTYTATFDDTWLYDGRDWRPVDPAQAPPARSEHAMAHDFARARTVLFGGAGANGFRSDTWEWDGLDWREVITNVVPPARYRHALAHDLIRGSTVLFGGTTFGPVFGDTWEFDGIDWRQALPSVSPAARHGHGLCFDLQRGAVVLCGGELQSRGMAPQFRADTWTWNGTTWVELPMPQARPRQRGCAATFDSARRVVVSVAVQEQPWELVGGSWQRRNVAPFLQQDCAVTYDRSRARPLWCGGNNGLGLAATVSFDGLNWLVLQPPQSPPARARSALAWDAARRQAVLFGGVDWWRSAGEELADTWRFDGSTWRPAATILAPAARYGHAMCYDSGHDRVVLYGGSAGMDSWGYPIHTFADTWSFDGTQWLPVPTVRGPGPRWQHALAYDAVRGAAILAGGGPSWRLDGAVWTRLMLPNDPAAVADAPLVYDDRTARLVLVDNGGGATWFLPAPEAAVFARHGPGCGGSAGVPSLDAANGAVPVLGAPFVLDLTRLPAQPGVALLVYGFDLVQWNQALLPVELAPLGLPGCSVWLAPEGAQPFAHGNGVLQATLAIPNQIGLRGTRLGVQAIVPDPMATNGVGALSNAAILQLW